MTTACGTVVTNGVSNLSISRGADRLLLLRLFYQKNKTLAGFEPSQKCTPLAGYQVQVDGITPKFNQPGLVRMQAKTESLQAFPKVLQKTPCLRHVLESHHEVIRIANEDDFARGVFLPPLVSPEIEDIMQIDIRQER